MSGIGRGRGWLNINKNINTKPGIPSPVETTVNHDFNSSPPKINSKFANIISKISLYNENDDGILINQKLKHIIEEYTKDCSDGKEAEETFSNIYENCLHDEEFAAKAVAVASSTSFIKATVHGVKIRSLFITQFQQDFEASKQMQTNNPKVFRIAVKMLGDFFHKARLSDGRQLHFLSSPMMKYLEMLLDSATESDLQLFTVLLYMNGSGIKEQLPSKLNDVLFQVRNLLAFNDRLSSTSKLWLMMALDISNNRYNFLPNDLHQYYLNQLGDDAMARIKKLTTELSIQTNYQNINLDSIQSSVAVLQPVSTDGDRWENRPSNAATDAEKPSSEISHAGFSNKPRNYNKNADGSFSSIGTWEQPKNEKTPRPILGAGVRLKQAENKAEDGSNWRERKSDGEWKENSSSWDNKKGAGSGWNNKPKKNVSKGWEHDDRFENEYN